MIQENDDDVIVNQNQQLLQQKTKTTVEVSYPIYQKICDYISKKYPNTEELGDEKAKEIDNIFSVGIDKLEKELECILLFEEKNPRKDVLINLGKIANEFLSNPDYPKINAMSNTKTINKIMGSKDHRTKEKYHRCVHQYLGIPKEQGLTNVSGFVNRIPKQILDTTSSTSSFIEQDIENETL